METKVQCRICGKWFQFVNNTHLKQHNLTVELYQSMYPGVAVKSQDLLHRISNAAIGKTYEERYGVDTAVELRERRRQAALRQMKDPSQIQIRREKCGLPEYYTDARKSNMSSSITTAMRQERSVRMLQAIADGKLTVGRQSKQAIDYIISFLLENNIPESKSYYFKGGRTGDEWITCVLDPATGKKQVVSYDLVTYDQTDSIDVILEVHGPWHYRLEQVQEDPHGYATPFAADKITKVQSFNKDVLKLNHALDIAKRVYVYWLDTKTLIQVENKMETYEVD